MVTVVNCCSGWSKHVAACPPRKRPGAQPLRESLSVGLAARYLEPTQHHPPPLAPNNKANNGVTRAPSSAPSLPPPLRAALVSLHRLPSVCVSRSTCLLAAPPTSRPCSLPLRLHTHQAAFHIKLDLRPSTPPSVAHTHFLPTHTQHRRLPLPPCRGSSPRVRRRQCRPDLPAPTVLNPTSTP